MEHLLELNEFTRRKTLCNASYILLRHGASVSFTRVVAIPNCQHLSNLFFHILAGHVISKNCYFIVRNLEQNRGFTLLKRNAYDEGRDLTRNNHKVSR